VTTLETTLSPITSGKDSAMFCL